MEKKNRPVQQAANSDIRTSDVTPPAPTQVNHNADAGYHGFLSLILPTF
jgi:hypothetical protein